MKIRSVELTNFRKFVGTVRVDGIGDNVNVLVGRNELGKSTLLEAINGVIFEKAKSTAAHVRAYRHFVNGTVPEVRLAFEVNGKNWTIHKRFAGQAGKATLTCSDRRIFEDDAAEAELQRLLGFTGGRGGGEPGIWGTLWVQQGRSLGDAELDEQAQRTMQSCLEAQVGVVTGGARGQKIPKAVKDALNEIRSTRGPRGHFKDAIDRLQENKAKITDLEAKRQAVFQLMGDLATSRRELKLTTEEWDEAAHRLELDGERTKRTAAATRAAEVSAARDAATLVRERATNARNRVDERAQAVADLEPLETQLTEAQSDAAKALAASTDARGAVEAAEKRLSALRTDSNRSAELARTLERTRAAVLLNSEICQQQATLDKAAALELEAASLSEMIGAIASTDEAVARIDAAVTELSAADAAMNAVATTISFSVQERARKSVSLDGERLESASASVAVVGKTVIAIQDIGTIAVEPQIKNRSALLARREAAKVEMKAALDAAGVNDVASARVAAAQRKEHERRLAEIKKELRNLAPGDPAKKLAVGLEALRNYLAGLRGRLKVEMEKLALKELPEANDLAREIEKNQEEGARLAGGIGVSEAELKGLQKVLFAADKNLGTVREHIAALNATIDTKKADLQASRANMSDAELSKSADDLEAEAELKEQVLAEKERNQGESPEAIDARIKRLEATATNHQRAVVNLNTEVTRLTALIAANEGAGVEELLLAAEAERERMTATVAEFEQEAAVLQLLLETLEAAESEAKNRYLAPVISRVQPYLKMLLPNADIVLDEDLHISALQRDGQREGFELLSGGTKEQLAVLTRLAFAELLIEQGRPATVVLDDALAFSDDDRIESMFDILARAGERVQIVILTCRRRLFTRLGAEPLEIRATT